MDFPGCLIVVSHDRYFMDKIVDHLFVFEDQKIKDFPGNYSDYRQYDDTKITEEPKVEKTVSSPIENEKSKSLSYLDQKEIKQLEKKIQNLEKEKEQLQKAFLEELSAEKIKENSIKLQGVEDEIEESTERWFELSS
jgi:ATP-binding cassette subfamily F protein uup